MKIGERIHVVADLAHEGKFIPGRLETPQGGLKNFEAAVAVAEQGHLFGDGHAIALERRVEIVSVDGEGNHVWGREEAHQQGGKSQPVEFDPRQAEV